MKYEKCFTNAQFCSQLSHSVWRPDGPQQSLLATFWSEFAISVSLEWHGLILSWLPDMSMTDIPSDTLFTGDIILLAHELNGKNTNKIIKSPLIMARNVPDWLVWLFDVNTRTITIPYIFQHSYSIISCNLTDKDQLKFCKWRIYNEITSNWDNKYRLNIMLS